MIKLKLRKDIMLTSIVIAAIACATAIVKSHAQNSDSNSSKRRPLERVRFLEKYRGTSAGDEARVTLDSWYKIKTDMYGKNLILDERSLTCQVYSKESSRIIYGTDTNFDKNWDYIAVTPIEATIEATIPPVFDVTGRLEQAIKDICVPENRSVKYNGLKDK